MATLKVIYSAANNMGDRLNPLIIERCFGYKVISANPYNAELSAIGSHMGTLFAGRGAVKSILKRARALNASTLYVWGTGFIREGSSEPLLRRATRFCAVRGELTKHRVEKAIGQNLEIPTGDAGILAPKLLKEFPEKQYTLGIIPHYKEQNDSRFKDLANLSKDSIIIDLKGDPVEVIKTIASCEAILSSSLHGLIVADSFGIPNLHVVATNNLMGDGFKFDDYYSAYGVKHNAVDLSTNSVSSLSQIADQYEISMSAVEEKQRQLLECFPYPTVL